MKSATASLWMGAYSCYARHEAGLWRSACRCLQALLFWAVPRMDGSANLESTIPVRFIRTGDEERGPECHTQAAAPEPRSVSHPNIYCIGAVRPRVATGPRLLPLLDHKHPNRCSAPSHKATALAASPRSQSCWAHSRQQPSRFPSAGHPANT